MLFTRAWSIPSPLVCLLCLSSSPPHSPPPTPPPPPPPPLPPTPHPTRPHSSLAVTGSLNAGVFLARGIYLSIFYPERLIIVDSPVCTAKMEVTAEAFESSKDAYEEHLGEALKNRPSNLHLQRSSVAMLMSQASGDTKELPRTPSVFAMFSSPIAEGDDGGGKDGTKRDKEQHKRPATYTDADAKKKRTSSAKKKERIRSAIPRSGQGGSMG